MLKLTYANFTRLLKDRSFWITVAAMVIANLVNVLNGVRQAQQTASDFGRTLDHYCFGFMPMLGLFTAAFISLFQGTEYSDGTLRNKLIVGHTRVSIYLSSLLTSYVASALILTAGLLSGLAGAPTFGGLQLGVSGVLCYLLLSLLMSGVWCALFTLIGMLISNRSYSAVFCILTWLLLTYLGSRFYNALSEPELQSGVLITENGMTMSDPTPNPNYVGGFKRLVYEFLSDLFPSSQGIMICNLEVVRPLRMALCSVALTAATTAVGVLRFRRKDLK